MKNIPNKIFLNIGYEPEKGDDFNELGEVTQCVDKINDNDIEYQRKTIWHDLRKNPSDLPKDDRNVIACVVFNNGARTTEIACYTYRWVLNSTLSRKSVIAWMDIPKFK